MRLCQRRARAGFNKSSSTARQRMYESLVQLLQEYPKTFAVHLVILGTFAFYLLVRDIPTGRAAQPSMADTNKLNSLPEVPQAVAAVGAHAKPDGTHLDPPKDDPISLEELAKCDGSTADAPIYVAIKGTVFDVTPKREMYGPGGGYHVFAGKDGSKGLGKSSLKPEDAVSDYSDLPASELKVLDEWVAYFTKRYNIVGKVATA
ncbi:uncharacterized protein L969DRAFT_53627 [Mixia osmundae IAM 14324]|uniref:Cytochrome b5 heme-binding domain-containing protein n=1 Tax=Mixia osmundae (strain CBS 9802 / IAM 14324 / JCM 22182 / KY 12970) TaxID=764103 RepID=G7EB22_MIXOS|nr:uncharacterized protein L969DRAFT_53627 [Mixia osmundae IAM 14324]KEI37065.1 hypothetical protein L969DRAFT_53627 [Mixia osmundae IAM 14324]GAB00033.1 hypothetical protein E5Q_06735 [Mixia osmundae IAM 14324]